MVVGIEGCAVCACVAWLLMPPDSWRYLVVVGSAGGRGVPSGLVARIEGCAVCMHMSSLMIE